MQFHVGAARQPFDDAGFDAVLEHGAVATLQANTSPVGHEVHYGGSTTMPMRPIQVVALGEMWNFNAMTSFVALRVSTM